MSRFIVTLSLKWQPCFNTIPLISSLAEKFPSAAQAGLARIAAAAPGSDSAGGVPGGGGGGGNEGDTFVVQRGRTVPTLSSVSSTTDKEHLNQVLFT